ncbi:AraC family transcriptional regulator [Streptomyces sp. G45]|uniref:AraC family transcriptional regulator n=1 Tax=Streptomyces sp. G45 TaxID=3406627 RepID=UPI003C16FFB3
MDVVSDAIAAVRTGRPVVNRARVAGRWCTRLAPYEGAGFHAVLEGSCRLLPDDGPPVTLGAGDVLLLPHGSGHVLADMTADRDTAGHAVPFERWLEDGGAGVGGGARADGGGGGDSGVGGVGGVGDDGGDGGVGARGDGGGSVAPVEVLCGKYRFDRSHPHPLLTELPDVVHLPHRPGSHPELRSAIGLLAAETAGPRPGGCIAVPGLLDLLLVYLVRAWAAERAAGGAAGWAGALQDPAVAAALRLLHEDPARPWTTARLAARAGVSRATLTRRFTALVGRPPMAYLTWWRMTRAAALLRAGDAPLAAVARQVGYGSPYALSHAFTRAFGTTPGRYRANGGVTAPS